MAIRTMDTGSTSTYLFVRPWMRPYGSHLSKYAKVRIYPRAVYLKKFPREIKMKKGKFWNEKEENISSDELMHLRMDKLLNQLKYCNNNMFYNEKFKDIGLEPEDIKTWEDFRKIPVIMNKDIERKNRDESIAKSGHPLGTHLCAPLTEIIGAYHTSGTTGMHLLLRGSRQGDV